MIYYFYSIQKGLIGLVNYRLVQNSLKTDKNKLIEELKKKGKSKGYIYTCRQKEGLFFNNAYISKQRNRIVQVAHKSLKWGPLVSADRDISH